ncbi:3-oxoacyl-acyl-carrier-protein reductase FabG [Porphyridium purpureum]|uniref:3-oxoacyl-[acyl-carrier-protein] reductase n=1 Tax=Porphyridium purpureum TaxID=35688 RepID=A0A5J4Z061_PORPP|nr:3-oxoacyl-acyl-carrier-protein reductase FabG [Porphyridium purpureum]|eukprot:POR7436..scf208_2
MINRELDADLKTAMVTGASGVLGQATVRMFLEEGFRVVVHDASVEALNDFVSKLGSLATRENIYPICFDPTNQDSVSTACERIQRDFAPVYILVNNCGILSNTLSSETSLEDWHDLFAHNVDSTFLMCKELLPYMKERKWGRIINTCSLAGKTGGVTTGIGYAASKGAVHTMTFALARESAKDGVTVNGIAPAYIRTPTVELYPEEMVSMLLKYIPVGRFCEPEEFSHAVKFLVSPLAGFITGSILDLNGGLLVG